VTCAFFIKCHICDSVVVVIMVSAVERLQLHDTISDLYGLTLSACDADT